MRKWMTGLLLAAALTGGVAAQDTMPIEYQGYDWFSDHVRFTYPPEVGGFVNATYTPASTETDVPGGAMPETVAFTFQQYDETEGWQDTGSSIRVYPVSTFPESDQPATQTLEAVQELLGLDDAAFEERIAANGIPSIEQITASQIFTAQEARLDFQSGTGVRFVTAAAQDVGPILNNMVYYNYQGITEDGNYYVSATFPISAPTLSDEAEPMDEAAYNEFAQNYETYVAETATALDALSPEEFTPNLETLDAVIASLIIEPPLAVFDLTETEGMVEAEDVTFTVDAALAHRMEVDAVAAVQGEEALMTMFGEAPGYTFYTLIGYPVDFGFIAPQIFILPVDEFPSEDVIFGSELARLQAFLAEKPELSSSVSNTNQEVLPQLPVLNAGQIVVSQPEYVDFANGTGVRYLTYYAQDVSPITDSSLFYTYQGITNDGQYVVSARFPVSTSVLPDEMPTMDEAAYTEFAQNYETYLDETVAALDAQGVDEFTPSLTSLDALIASINVE